MQYRAFGKTGIHISALGFGAMRLPQMTVGEKTEWDVEESIRMIHRAVDLGVNYIDTAPLYCDGQSEIIVGKALKGIRDQVYLSTKNGIGQDDSGEHFTERLEKSLQNLDTDYIDFYHMWGINWQQYGDKIDVKNGPLQAAFKAKEQGLIKHLSFSFHDNPENMFKLIDTGHFETLLCQYNLLDRGNEDGIAYAHEKGLGVVIMGPVAGGRLGAPSQIIQKLMPKAMASSAEIALRFVLANQSVSCALSGMSSMLMVEENCRTASNEKHLSAQEVQAIKHSMTENKQLADLYCTGCGYCMPCPHDVNIPHNFSLMNYHRVYGLTEFAKQEYANIGTNPWIKGKKAEACVNCGICEDKCPQKIAIRKQLAETVEALKL
ncbi:MAG: aldo/keto reductase [Hyphomonadaceae bacterium]|nr:aldo/keto reductase [Clostridia bacterium]